MIPNYGFGSLLFIGDQRNIRIEVTTVCIFNDFLGTYLKTYFFNGQKNVQRRSGSVIQDYESADSNPKEILTDPQHWLSVLLSQRVATGAKTSEPSYMRPRWQQLLIQKRAEKLIWKTGEGRREGWVAT